MKSKNTTQCTDNGHGEDICIESGDFDCTVIFASTCNCSLALVQSVVKAEGMRRDTFSNAVDCKVTSGLIFRNGCPFSLDNCCFFRISNTACHGSPTFTNCVGDFELSGITRIGAESTHRMEMEDACLATFCFSRGTKETGLVCLWTVALVFLNCLILC